MKKLLQISIFVLLAIMWVMIGLSYADTHIAATCSLTDVQNAISLASNGDTVIVPKGKCTWSSKLTITKAIRLQGAQTVASTQTVDDDNDTIITLANPNTGELVGITADAAGNCPLNIGTAASLCSVGISFEFKNGSAAIADTPIEVTKFVFKQAMTLTNIIVIYILNGDGDNPLNKVLIHDNLMNLRQDARTGQSSFPINVDGYVYGVFYNNTVYIRKPTFGFSVNNVFSSGGTCNWLGKYEWIHPARYSPGNNKTFFVEDNTFYFTYTTAVHMGSVTHSGSAVYRYNTFINQDTTSTGSQWNTDVHGAYPSRYPPVGMESYGNFYQRSYSGTYGVGLVFLRTGKNMIFGNLVKNTGTGGTSVSIAMQRECDECLALFGSYSNYTCPTTTTTMSGCKGIKKCGSTGQPYYVNDTYIFQNRHGATGSTLMTSVTSSSGGTGTPERCPVSKGYTAALAAREGFEWWRDNTNCVSGGACASGIGCGTTLPTTCTAGTGFWLTNQSCSQLTTANVGAGGNPATKAQTGTFYRCSPTNTWSVYYTPYTYPHPLREDAPTDTDAPSITQPCAGSGSCSYPIIQIACDDLDDTEDIVIGITATDSSQATTVCYYDLESRADYAAMAANGHAFTASGTSYTATVEGLACASSHTFWYACSDGTNHTSVGNTSFVIAGRGDNIPAVVTNTTTAKQACSSIQRITITTDKPATAKFCKAGETIGEGICDANTSYADMPHTFSVTGGETGHVAHSTDISQECSSTVTWYVRTSTTQGAANTTSTAIPITTDATKSVTITGTGLTVTIGTGSKSIQILP